MSILANVISLGLCVPVVGLYISIFSELCDPVDSEELNALTPLRLMPVQGVLVDFGLTTHGLPCEV